MMKAKTDRKEAEIIIKKLRVENEFLDINLEAEKACQQILEDKLEEEIEKKKQAEKLNDDLIQQTKSADELQKNQMERALQRDKGVEITELRAKHATMNELNDEMMRKLQEEKNKFDKLKHEHIVLTEKLKAMEL